MGKTLDGQGTNPTWSGLTWQLREKTLGDPAEAAFIDWADREGYVPVRYGLNRPPLEVGKLSAFIRYTPDFLTTECLFEVQGCGQDQTFKFKHDKLWSLFEWSQHFPVRLWLWNQTLDKHVAPQLNHVISFCINDNGYRVDGVFDGTKAYAAVTWDELVSKT